MNDAVQKPTGIALQFSLGVWIIGAQVFYFYQYSPTIIPVLRGFYHKLWP
jgi:hypothetical protein